MTQTIKLKIHSITQLITYRNSFKSLSEINVDEEVYVMLKAIVLNNTKPISIDSLIYIIGLRPATLIAAILVAAGAGVRCITDNPDYIKWYNI